MVLLVPLSLLHLDAHIKGRMIGRSLYDGAARNTRTKIPIYEPAFGQT